MVAGGWGWSAGWKKSAARGGSEGPVRCPQGWGWGRWEIEKRENRKAASAKAGGWGGDCEEQHEGGLCTREISVVVKQFCVSTAVVVEPPHVIKCHRTTRVHYINVKVLDRILCSKDLRCDHWWKLGEGHRTFLC